MIVSKNLKNDHNIMKLTVLNEQDTLSQNIQSDIEICYKFKRFRCTLFSTMSSYSAKTYIFIINIHISN